jgi:hypothetical protein
MQHLRILNMHTEVESDCPQKRRATLADAHMKTTESMLPAIWSQS